MSDLVINVKQIGSYPTKTASDGTETLLVQTNGLGGPYASISSKTLVQTALNNASMGVGFAVPDAAVAGDIFCGSISVPDGYAVLWNNFNDGLVNRYINAGLAGRIGFDPDWGGFHVMVGTAGQPGDAVPWSTMLSLSIAGNLSLPFGTLTVARDPAVPNEVATLNYVANNTVQSFNNRQGAVTLTCQDVYSALQLIDPIATQPFVYNAIQQGIQNLLITCPFVNSWNGRSGQVFLMLSDIECVFYQAGQQPMSPTPISTSNDDSIATTAWVTTYINNELAGSGGSLASQSWVLANTVNSFNGRLGVVNLTAADVFDVGAAPLNSPAFSGIPNAPTANPGTSTAQLATTAFVMSAVSASTAGVSSFNTRTGAVVLTNADISGAGGLANPNVNLTGIPVAPTAAANTNTTQIATTAFVTAAVNATVTSFNTRTGAVTLQLTDVTGVGGAPLASPTFTGTPAAPTASPGTSTTQLATTQFVTAAITAAGGVSSFNSRTGAVTLTNNDITAAGGISNPSANLTGTPTAPTAAPGTNTTQLATTGFVTAAVGASVLSFNTRTGAVTLSAADITGAGGALLASPAFSGTPTAPTATAGTSNTQLATTAFVAAAVSAGTAGVTSFNTRTGAVTLVAADVTGVGGALLASPAFTGTPTAPTATAGTSTTQLATTAFVAAAVGSGGVTSFNTRTGAVTLQANDVSAAGGALIASPTFTGTPAAPTAAANTSTTQLATTAYVVGQAATVAPNMDGTAATGTSLLYARQDHVHPIDTSRAPLASPTFTGTPAAPTAAVNTSTTQLATTAYVVGQAGTAAPTMNGTATVGTSLLYARQDHIHPSDTSRVALAGGTMTGALNLVGVANASNAAAGQVGEFLSVAGTQQSWGGGGAWGQVTSLTLSAGDWDVQGSLRVVQNGQNIQWITTAIGTGNGTDPGIPYAGMNISPNNALSWHTTVPYARFNVSVSTTIYLNAAVQVVTSGAGVVLVQGWLWARRMR